ncbi:hypothetical protein ACJMK2_012611 [Sinanodonta woodiana]|uniref:Phospholipase A2-like central domain-containing protein n=1 Tax=Sinanodonta woodiana TaxID=1069815 RepID=A0ABD3VBS4_SINWO
MFISGILLLTLSQYCIGEQLYPGEIAHVSEPLPLGRFRFLVTDGKLLLEAVVSRINGVLLCDIHEAADGISSVLLHVKRNVTFIGQDYVKDMFEKCLQNKVLEKSRRDHNVVPNDTFDGMPFKPDYKTGQPDGNGAHLAIFPGTKWCGYENNAKDMNDLGVHQATDACCRIHDHCPYFIDRFETKYNYRNMNPYTVSHCDCDQGLYDCLKKVHTTTSNEVGELFFGLLNVHCFRFEKGPYCEKYHWSGIWCEKKSIGMRAVMQTFPHKWSENTDNIIAG